MLGGDFAALWIFSLLPFVAVKRDHVFHAKLGAGIDGLLGGFDHHVVVISDFEDATDYMSVVGKVMMGGATSDIKTVTCYTGAEAKIAMAKATGNDINYTPPS